MKSLLTFLFLCLLGFTFSQRTTLKFNFSQENTIDIPKYFKKPILLRAPSFLSIELNNAAIALAEVGYFGASFTIDSSQVNSFLVQIDLGRRFKGVEVSASNDVLSFMEPLLLRKEKKQGLYFFSSPTRYSRVLKSVIANFHNNGYPFACFMYDSLSADADVFHVRIAIQPGRKLKWDELLIKGDSSIALKPIEQIIGKIGRAHV